jgi:hypothetical protein
MQVLKKQFFGIMVPGFYLKYAEICRFRVQIVKLGKI